MKSKLKIDLLKNNIYFYNNFNILLIFFWLLFIYRVFSNTSLRMFYVPIIALLLYIYLFINDW